MEEKGKSTVCKIALIVCIILGLMVGFMAKDLMLDILLGGRLL